MGLRHNGIGFLSKGPALTTSALESPRGSTEGGNPLSAKAEVSVSDFSDIRPWKAGI